MECPRGMGQSASPRILEMSNWKSLSHSLARATEIKLPTGFSVKSEVTKGHSGARSCSPINDWDEVSELVSEGDEDEPCVNLNWRRALSRSACESPTGKPTIDAARALMKPDCHVSLLAARRAASKTALEVFDDPSDGLTGKTLRNDAGVTSSKLALTSGDGSLMPLATGSLPYPTVVPHSSSHTESRSSGEVFQRGRFTVTVAPKRSPRRAFTFEREAFLGKTLNQSAVDSGSSLTPVSSDLHIKRSRSTGAMLTGQLALTRSLPSLPAARSVPASLAPLGVSSTLANSAVTPPAGWVVCMMGEQHHLFCSRVRQALSDLRQPYPLHCCYQHQAAGMFTFPATGVLKQRSIRTVSPNELKETAYRLPRTMTTGASSRANGRTGEILGGVHAQAMRTRGYGNIEEVIASSSTGRRFTVVRRGGRASTGDSTGEAAANQLLHAENLDLDIPFIASIPPLMSTGRAPHAPYSTSASPCLSPCQPPPISIGVEADEAPSVCSTISSTITVRTADSGYGTATSASRPASSIYEGNSSAESASLPPHRPPLVLEGEIVVQRSQSNACHGAVAHGGDAAAAASKSTVHGRRGRKFVITREKTI